MSKIREFLDRLLLSDHRWKKKYCPNLYYALTNPDEFWMKVRSPENVAKAQRDYKEYWEGIERGKG